MLEKGIGQNVVWVLLFELLIHKLDDGLLVFEKLVDVFDSGTKNFSVD